MTTEQLKTKSKEQVHAFIKEKLAFKGVSEHLRYCNEEIKAEHRRFEMSGYEKERGHCTLNTQAILNEFAYLGIYDYTEYLFLDFHKGCGTLYLKYWGGDENLEIDYSGYGTTEIIYRILGLTIFSGRATRRRD